MVLALFGLEFSGSVDVSSCVVFGFASLSISVCGFGGSMYVVGCVGGGFPAF